MAPGAVREPPIAVQRLDHVVLRVRDLESALRFYAGALGCREERRLEDLGLVQLRAGSSLIDLVPVDGELGRAGGGPPGVDGRNVDHIALRIERLDHAALDHLAAHGVPVGERAQRYGAEGMGWSVYLRDPDGNIVELRGPPGE